MFELISNSSDVISQENNGTILSYILEQLQRSCEFLHFTSDCIFPAEKEKKIITSFFHININSPFINTGSCSWLCCSYIIPINWYKFNICLPGFNRHSFRLSWRVSLEERVSVEGKFVSHFCLLIKYILKHISASFSPLFKPTSSGCAIGRGAHDVNKSGASNWK